VSTLPHYPLVTDYLTHWARVAPEREVMVLGARRSTYAQVAREVDRLARALLASGVRRGERVAVMGTPSRASSSASQRMPRGITAKRSTRSRTSVDPSSAW
jgi:acyl-CoA synthetase (AMP-forming)/AMP-acid ligase II